MVCPWMASCLSGCIAPWKCGQIKACEYKTNGMTLLLDAYIYKCIYPKGHLCMQVLIAYHNTHFRTILKMFRIIAVTDRDFATSSSWTQLYSPDLKYGDWVTGKDVKDGIPLFSSYGRWV